MIISIPKLYACQLCLLLTAPATFAAVPFEPDDQPVGYVAQPELTNYDLSSDTETVFVTTYEAFDWMGNLLAYPIDKAGRFSKANERWQTTASKDKKAVFGVAYRLNKLQKWDERKIVTMSSTGQGMAFTKDAFNASAGGKTQACTVAWLDPSNPAVKVNDCPKNAEKIINFIRGDRSEEGKTYRRRMSILGDIIHSRPYYVNNAQGARVYVGANDGMLHAFNADFADTTNSGKEVFAYIPSMLLPDVKQLSINPYTHHYFVDGPINVGTVTCGASKTLLVGGLGAGGRGLFALDVSAPTAATVAAAAQKILWEITPETINNQANSSYAALGYTYSQPIIAEMSSGKSVVITGNGYLPGDQGIPVLFIIDACNGSLLKAVSVSCSGSSCGSAGRPSGLSSPAAIDKNDDGSTDGKIDWVYAGDLNGNLWKFDVRNLATAKAERLFQADRPITGAPSLSIHPQGGLMVIFGTGQMLLSWDKNDKSTDSIYGIWDGAPAENTTLLTQKLVDAETDAGYVRVATATAPQWDMHRGWKIALPAGERVIGDLSFIANNRFYVTTTNPTLVTDKSDDPTIVPGTSDPLTPRGENWLVELDYLSGGGRMMPMFDLDNDGSVNEKDLATSIDTTSETDLTQAPIGKFIAAGVLSHPVLVGFGQFDTTLFNGNPNISLSTPQGASVEPGPGVAFGHFDFDIYYGASRFAKVKHVHEYDDKYNVIGVNMLNASDPTFNLVNAIPDPSGPGSIKPSFKILLCNQALSRAVEYKFGAMAAYNNIKDYQTTAGLTLAAVPTYTRANIGNLLLKMPTDAFAVKDWWGDGDKRAGLIPTQTGCVNNMSVKSYNPNPGKLGEINNGALTVQIIRSDTPDSAIEPAVAGKPTYGYRVKGNTSGGSTPDFWNYVLAQYTLFWHHPNGACYDDADWTAKAPEDRSGQDSGRSIPPSGTADPRADAVSQDSGETTDMGGDVSDLYSDAAQTIQVQYVMDGSMPVTKTTTITFKNKAGQVIKTVKLESRQDTTLTDVTGGGQFQQVDRSSKLHRGLNERGSRAKTGRVSWRELFRD